MVSTVFICAGPDNSGRPEPAADIFTNFLKLLMRWKVYSNLENLVLWGEIKAGPSGLGLFT